MTRLSLDLCKVLPVWVHAHRATCFHAFTGLNVAQLTNSEDHASGGCGLFWMQGTVREFVWW